jgi:putative ABC transport system permease protein
MRIPLLAGRAFDARDRLGAPAVCLINEALARAYFRGEEAVGNRIRVGFANAAYPKGTWWRIAGIVGDTRQKDLESAAPPQVYLPLGEVPAEGISYVLRASVGAVELRAAIREQAAQVDPALEEPRPRAMADLVSRTMTQRRMALWLVGGFAGLALVLTGVGIHGLVAYSVALRTREIGIRMALGARPGATLRMMLREGLGLALWGGVIGLAGSVWAARLIENQLVGVRAGDPVVMGAACAVLAVVAAAAGLIPAWRAARVDPAVCLRAE